MSVCFEPAGRFAAGTELPVLAIGNATTEGLFETMGLTFEHGSSMTIAAARKAVQKVQSKPIELRGCMKAFDTFLEDAAKVGAKRIKWSGCIMVDGQMMI